MAIDPTEVADVPLHSALLLQQLENPSLLLPAWLGILPVFHPLFHCGFLWFFIAGHPYPLPLDTASYVGSLVTYGVPCLKTSPLEGLGGLVGRSASCTGD